MRLTSTIAAMAVFFMAAAPLPIFAQEANPTANTTDGTQNGGIQNGGEPTGHSAGGGPIYTVKVVSRDLPAVNYFHRSGSTKVGLQGTELMSAAKGSAEVKSDRGRLAVSVKFENLTPANGFGPEYLTYVLWAITPDGKPQNLGEILPAGTKGDINVTTSLQSFGLIITAEPYFSVSTPSDIVVMQNVVINDKTQGVIEPVIAHYTLLPRGAYTVTSGPHTVIDPITRNEHSPLELYEAHNAVRLAELAGAAQYSPQTLAAAKTDLKNADDMDSSKHRDEKQEITFAREAVQRAEDARVDTLRKQQAERERNREEAKNQAQADAATAQSQAQAAQAAKDQADADRARAEAQAAAARNQAAAAQTAAQASLQQASAAREKLRAQLNAVLQTTENARGLIVNMSDVLFDTGKYTLKSGTQVTLAKVAGILQAYPGLKLQVEGYTDIVGGDDYNQKLSENRANAVRDFLAKQGVSMDSISAAGYGKADPVADNGTAAGRAQNRRVQLVVSGQAIGIDQQSAPQ
jgi:outer membrane protein OmpA-like peptidoglycan-associated protein